MKKAVFFLLFLNSVFCSAEDGFSLSADYGFGQSFERKANPFAQNYYYQAWTFSPSGCWKADVYISYKKGHWIAETGVGYWKDGYVRSQPYYNYYNVNMGSLTTNGNLGVVYANSSGITETFKYPQIAIPFLLGYQINIVKKLSVIPYLGAAVSNNRNSSFKNVDNGDSYTHDLTNNDFNMGYKRTDWSALAQLYISYKITPRLGISLGPHFAYMLTNMVKNEYWTYEQSPLMLYNITLNAGITWQIVKGKPSQPGISK